DVLLVHILAPVVQTHRAVVSATGDILIPRIGMLSVRGMSLAQARKELRQLVLQRNPSASADVQLAIPRRVIVTVTGYVRAPGTYILPGNVRVSTAVRIAMQGEQAAVSGGKGRGAVVAPLVSSLQEIGVQEWEPSSIPPLPSYCVRNIILRSADGRLRTADLERGRAMNDLVADPTVSEGLEIVVPAPPPEGYPTISIGGAVRRPLRVAYRAGDKLSFLLRLSGGLKEGSAEPAALVYIPGQPPRRVGLDTAGMPLTEVELLPGSVVIVPERPVAGSGLRGMVRVVGSVLHPGTYVIEPRRTRLREVIHQAGGFTPAAALAYAYIQRVPPQELATVDPRIPSEVGLYSRFLYSDLRLEDTVRYILDMRLQRSLVSCDFVALFQRGDLSHDVPLEDGDVIVVPQASPHVYVWGQVRLPGFVPFEPNQIPEWYIQRAGGYGVGADEKRVRILRGPARHWLEPKEAGIIQPGDEIYVPRRLDVPAWAQQQTELQLYTVLVGAASTLTFIVTTIINLLRR
ncbi:MAG: SLBB domain-containing protein, partial [Candidatus Kapabacteria bacterium]|nr:SLBB domain-containing protein [Candidatus Kapabacteria bacterium]